MPENNVSCINGESDRECDEKEHIRIKINHSRENKVKGFYILMTNGNTYSDKKDEFIIERKFTKKLDENNIDYEELPLNPISD